MTTLKNELTELFSNNRSLAEELMYGYDLGGVEPFEELPGVSYKCLDSYGGEDQGSDYYNVYEFRRGDEVELVKFHGWYASYHGADYEGFYFVKPVQKTITVYE